MIKMITGQWVYFIVAPMLAFLMLLTLYLLDAAVGMGDAYLVLSQYCGDVIKNRQLDKFPIDWQTGFIGGMVIGGAIAAIISGEWKFKLFPEDGGGDFISASLITPIEGIGGGFLVMFGLQIGGDTLLGHWSSAMQLSTGAWLFLFITLTSSFTYRFISNRISKGGK